MPAYASADDVKSRLGKRPLTETSFPSVAHVTAWIDEAEAEILGALEVIGVPRSSLSGSVILRGWVASFVAGVYRRSMAAAGGDGENRDGQEEISEWRDRLRRMQESPASFVSMFSGGVTPSGGSDVRSLATDDAANLRAPMFGDGFKP